MHETFTCTFNSPLAQNHHRCDVIFLLSEMSDYSRLTCTYIIKGNPKTLTLETGIRNWKPESGIQIL